MKIDIEEFLMNYIGHIDWQGETNYDNESYDNMIKAGEVLNVLENIRDNIMSNLIEHRDYRQGNASAEMLYKKAKEIMRKRCRYDGTIDTFNEQWSD